MKSPTNSFFFDGIRADVQAGFDQLARGQGKIYDKASGRRLIERIKSDGRAARAAKKR